MNSRVDPSVDLTGCDVSGKGPRYGGPQAVLCLPDRCTDLLLPEAAALASKCERWWRAGMHGGGKNGKHVCVMRWPTRQVPWVTWWCAKAAAQPPRFFFVVVSGRVNVHGITHDLLNKTVQPPWCSSWAAELNGRTVLCVMILSSEWRYSCPPGGNSGGRAYE